MKKISQADEDRLMGAVEQTATLVNDGESPNTAIVKAAVAAGVPHGHVHLMVHAYNTGRTTKQRTSHDDPFEKAADFELADTATVLELLRAKTAAALPIADCYARSPRRDLEAYARAQRVKLAATVDWRAWSGVPTPAPAAPEGQMRKAYAARAKRANDLAAARQRYVAAHEKMAAAFQELVEYFRTPDAQPLAVVREQSLILHGEKAAKLIDLVAEHAPELARRPYFKQAFAGLVAADGGAYSLISQVLDHLDECSSAKQAHADVVAAYHAADAAAATASSAKAASVADPILDGPLPDLIAANFDPILDGPMPTLPKAAGVMPTLVGASMMSSLMKNIGEMGQGASKATSRAMSALTDPGHEQALRSIAASASLQDMMLNDPIVSSYPADRVISAYNDLAEMAPRATSQRAVVQSLLRKRLTQGSLDPFDLDQVLGMEDKERKIQAQGSGNDSVLA